MSAVSGPTRDHRLVPAVLVIQVLVQTPVLFVLVRLLLALRLPGRLPLCAGRAGQTAVHPALQRGAPLLSLEAEITHHKTSLSSTTLLYHGHPFNAQN